MGSSNSITGLIRKGLVVIINWKFTDESGEKPRPTVVVVMEPTGEDVTVAMITSGTPKVNYPTITLKNSDFKQGSIDHDSFIRPDMLQTIRSNRVLKIIGDLTDQKYLELSEAIASLTKKN